MRLSAAWISVIFASACSGGGTPSGGGGGNAPVDGGDGSGSGDGSVDAGPDAPGETLARAIVFAATLDGQSQPDLYRMNADGSRVVRLTTTAGAERFPAWSPDHSRVAFVRDAHLYVLDLASGGERMIAEHVGREGTNGYPAITGPAWSPDGTRLVYPYPRATYPVGEGGLDESYDTTLHFVNADGTNDVAYNEPAETGAPPGIGTLAEAAWSSTGLIAFTVSDDCPDCAGGSHYSYSKADGSGFKDILPADLGVYPLYPRHDLDWSPDATRWVFTSLWKFQGEPGDTILPRISTRSVADPDDIHAITTTGAWFPRYASDGTSIAFLRDDGIYVMSVDGTAQHRILNATSVRSLDW